MSNKFLGNNVKPENTHALLEYIFPNFGILSHYAKTDRIWSVSGPYFSTLGLNTDQKNSEYGHFSRITRLLLWNDGSRTFKT